MDLPLYIPLLFFVIAFIYGSVGHGGASGYLALLTLTGLFSPEMVPVVLILNILVSGTALANYGSRGHFVWRLFWPFAAGSIPAAFLGGYIQIELGLFYLIVGCVLLLMAGFITLRTFINPDPPKMYPVRIKSAVVLGVIIGFCSGLIGVGGGIFLSPLILLLKWGNIRQIAAVSALFVLVNSASGLAGHVFSTPVLWSTALLLAIPVVSGGFLGSWMGVKTANPAYIRLFLAVVLVIAGIKMLL